MRRPPVCIMDTQDKKPIRGWSLPSMSEVKAKSTHLKSLGFTTVASPAKGGTTVRSCVYPQHARMMTVQQQNLKKPSRPTTGRSSQVRMCVDDLATGSTWAHRATRQADSRAQASRHARQVIEMTWWEISLSSTIHCHKYAQARAMLTGPRRLKRHSRLGGLLRWPSRGRHDDCKLGNTSLHSSNQTTSSSAGRVGAARAVGHLTAAGGGAAAWRPSGC